jgi:hypothetical protein
MLRGLAIIAGCWLGLAYLSRPRGEVDAGGGDLYVPSPLDAVIEQPGTDLAGVFSVLDGSCLGTVRNVSGRLRWVGGPGNCPDGTRQQYEDERSLHEVAVLE